jgi:anti-anti-sigma factor
MSQGRNPFSNGEHEEPVNRWRTSLRSPIAIATPGVIKPSRGIRSQFVPFAEIESCAGVTALAIIRLPGNWKPAMPVAIHDLERNVTKVIISGRIDIAGARELELPMAIIAGSRRAVVIDLSAVDFMASLALRAIVVNAKAILSKRGKVVLLGPQPQVHEVITVSGIDELIAIYHTETEAIAAVS